MGYSVVHIDELEPSGPGGAPSGSCAVSSASNHPRLGRLPDRGSGCPVQRRHDLPFRPAETRQPVAGPDGFTMVAVGARQGSYEPRGPF
jgi:hypothetical protein